MGSKQKAHTTQTQTGSQTGTSTTTTGDTADINRLRGAVIPAEPDPSIPYTFANQRASIKDIYRNPLGAYTSPAVRDAANRGATKALDMGQYVAQEASRRAAQDQQFGQLSYIAGLTAPHTVTSSGTSSGTMTGDQVQTYNPGIGSYIAQGAGTAVGLL